MAPPNTNVQPRKRARKRKRRVASSSDLNSDSSPSSGPSSPVITRKVLVKPKAPESLQESSDSQDSSSSSESTLSRVASPAPITGGDEVAAVPEARQRECPSSPPPIANSPPAFLPPEDPSHSEAALRTRFKKFWMVSVADAFKNDLEEIRKEPSMTKARLAVLIDSLASGADIFTSSPRSASSPDDQVNEMEVILGSE
ncbi:uncharacterized protein PHACADRAFT_249145 [Phanerochaete carnosa HHB-10118-sp]|uniref:Ribosome assembly protein 3 n=1 Tax=Phanerochaete carnosa (strain HHB-10118-sp) TaxID=650164 RepID=K5X801_PHACS|nr:uncharacterized protein PHACADRAFT_249145 [Phanerochaete carnosa HHB-10118-sp]EKM58997.1 hypothetical protein PHACADRAFT_249145 [Phanerochaete carnosa HHB-10118-sp]